MRQIDAGFPGSTYSLKDLLRDEQRKVMGEVVGSVLKASESDIERHYHEQAPFLQVLNEFRFPIPKQMQATAELALNGVARRLAEGPELSLASIRDLLGQCRAAHVRLDTSALEITLRRTLEKNSQDFYQNPRDLLSLRKCREQVAAAAGIAAPLVLWAIQNYCYEILQTVYREMKASGESEWVNEFEQLSDLLSLRCP